MTDKLFTPFNLGKLTLANRVVMAPMTRSRATGNVPNDLMAKFYGDRAEADLAAGKGDLVAFGRPFIANPDLVRRLRQGVALASPDASTFYTPGGRGYADYPLATAA